MHVHILKTLVAVVLLSSVAAAQTSTPTWTPTHTPTATPTGTPTHTPTVTPTALATPFCGSGLNLPAGRNVMCKSIAVSTATPALTPVPFINEPDVAGEAIIVRSVRANFTAAARCTLQGDGRTFTQPYDSAGAGTIAQTTSYCFPANEEVEIVRESGGGTCTFTVCYHESTPR